MGCLLCIICDANSFHSSLLYKPCIYTNLIQIPWPVCVYVCVCVGGGGQSINLRIGMSIYSQVEISFIVC